jgi:PE-PPE domain
VNNDRGTALRITRSFGVALLALLAAVVIGLASTVSSAIQLLAATALIMTGTFTPTPSRQYIDMAMNQFIQPTRPDTYHPVVPITTPEEAWPVTGLFDDTFSRSLRIGLHDLETTIAECQVSSESCPARPGQPILIFGYSQSGVISMMHKRELNERYPVGTPDAPPIQFVLIGDLMRPNGGFMARYPFLNVPFGLFPSQGAELTDTQFPTVSIVRQYDGFGDWPLYPLNLLATANAVIGIALVHTDYQSVSLDPDDPRYVQGTRVDQFADTTYYTIPTADLPLLFPARALGVPEPVIDIVEPVLTWAVELGYDRSINPGVPTRARLIPRIDPVTAIDDLIDAINEGVDNALAVHGSPPPVAIPAPRSERRPSLATAPGINAIEPPAAPLPGDSATPEQEVTPPATEPQKAPEPETSNDADDTTEPEKATPSTAKPKPTAHRPKLRGPIGVFGPRTRDLLHRGHNDSAKQTRTEEDRSSSESPETTSSTRSPSVGAENPS